MLTLARDGWNPINIGRSHTFELEIKMSQHSRFTTILEQSLDRAFAEHGYLDSVIEMWENMMFAAEYEYDDIIESYKFVLSRTNESWIESALKSAILKLSNS